MNAIKILLAVSAVVAAASSANAAIYTFSVSKNQPLATSGFTGSNSGTGTASLDTVTGVLDIVISPTTYAIYDPYDMAHAFLGSGTYTEHDIFNGTLTGSAFAWTSASTTGSDCTASGFFGTNICIGVANGTGTNTKTSAFTPNENPITFNFGSVTTFTNTQTAFDGELQVATYLLTNTTPAVPVPAAAWLFGSGLLGLAGVARRRAA